MTFEDLAREVRALSVEQRKQLIALIVDSLTSRESEEQVQSILSFEGIGERLRDKTDPQEAISRLREEWDHRP
jgi:hypothetical protein